jgi:hypothetical protein
VELLEFLYSLEPRRALAGAIILSILLYTISANLAWASIAPRGDRFSRFVGWWNRQRLRGVILELARWIYYLAFPWAALMLGYTTARAMGVWNLDWLMNLWIGVIVAAGGAIVFVWVWRPYAQSEHPEAVDLTGWSGARQIIEAIYQEAHWAFYRCGPILWLNDYYWGSFLGLTLNLIEGWTNPAVRTNIHDITRADAPLWAGTLSIISVLIFLYTQNTWYCLIVHLLLNYVLRPLIGLGTATQFRSTRSIDENQ